MREKKKRIIMGEVGTSTKWACNVDSITVETGDENAYDRYGDAGGEEPY